MATAADNASDRFAVRRWQARYLVPDGHPTPERVRERLDSVLRGDLIGPLSALLRLIADPGDPALVLVRRLSFDVAVDAGGSLDDIGAQCAHALAFSVSRELAAGDPTNIVRFSNRTDHLARFVVDTATGLAASRWYYATFAGLAALPASAAIRTALLADRDAGVAALRMLDDGDLAHVLAALGTRECEQVCAVAARAAAPDGAPDAFQHLAAAWHEHPAPIHVNTESQLALWLIARVAAPVESTLVIAARACAGLSLALARGQVTLATSDAPLNGLPAESLDVLRACPRDRREALTGAPPPGVELLGSTVFGGAFLLLDDLFALELAELLAGWPQATGSPPARAIGLLILGCSCLGPHAPALFADPLWRRMFGIEPALTFEVLAKWLETLGRGRRRALARASSRLRRSPRGVGHEATRDALASADDRIAVAPPPPVSTAWSRTIASLANRLLRNFAYRIPGYAASHACYLQHNFLSGSASAAANPTRIVVRLGRPPLALMLNIAGLNRGSRVWPALDDRPFALFTEECP